MDIKEEGGARLETLLVKGSGTLARRMAGVQLDISTTATRTVVVATRETTTSRAMRSKSRIPSLPA